MHKSTAESKTLSLTSKLFQKAQKEGTNEAMTNLINRIHDRLYRFSLCLTGNTHRAQDLCQDAYVRVLENIDTLDNPRYFVGWLYKITRNIFLDYVKSPRNAAYVELKDYSEALSRSSMAELGVQLAKTLNGLPPEDRYVLLLLCVEGRSITETAEILGITEEALRCKTYRMRKAMKGDFFTGRVVHGAPVAAGAKAAANGRRR